MHIENLKTSITLNVQLMPGIQNIVYDYCHSSKQMRVLVDGLLIKVLNGEVAINAFNSVKSYKADDTPLQRKIKIAVAKAWGFPFENLAERIRKPEVKEYRQIVMWWMKHNTVLCDREIAQFCGKYEHATVIHAAKYIDSMRDTDKKIAGKVELFLKAVAA